MKTPKKINKYRRKLMHKVTKGVGKSKGYSTPAFIPKEDIKTVLISRPNHRLGNQLLITPLIQEVSEIFPNCKIDLFVKGGLAPILFKNYENIDKIIQLPKKHFNNLIDYKNGWRFIKRKPYDLVINATKGSSSGRLSAKYANSKYKIFGDEMEGLELKYKDSNHNAKRPVYNLREYMAEHGMTKINKRPMPLLDIKLSEAELKNGHKILNGLIGKKGKTICIFTYATGEKCYSEDWWLKFHDELKLKFKDCNIIEVLPVENVSQILFKEPTFYSKDIREIGSLIANCDVFIGADGGIMHLSSAVHTPTIGLFSVTNIDIYEPYGNHSAGLKIDDNNQDEIISAVSKVLQSDKTETV